MKQYSTHILKSDTSSRDMNKKVDHWLDSFENFHKKYIIMPSESLNSSFIEESLFVTVWSPPGFINQETETRCYLNANIQMLYFNVLFGKLMLNLDCYTMVIGMDRKNQYFFHNYQNIMIMKELQKKLVRYIQGGGQFLLMYSLFQQI